MRFQAEATVDFSHGNRSELKINTYMIEGEAENALTFLNHFKAFRGVNLPLTGKLESGPGDMHLHAYIGDVEQLLAWRIALHFSEGPGP